MEVYDFSGYVTRNDLECSDGRVIRQDAFKHNDGETVPLVWMHQHNEPDNVLGHAQLENRTDGVYAYCKFNDSARAGHSKILVEHGDITSLSIYANQLKQQGSNVLHGAIKEVSLVISGANPGAYIENVSMAHAEDGYGEAIIYTGEEVAMDNYDTDYDLDFEHTDMEDATVGEIFDTLTETQKNVVYALIGDALGKDKKESVEHSSGGENFMKINVFDNEEITTGGVLTHDDMQAIFAEAVKTGSLKEATLAHAATYGIENIEVLFPDARSINNEPTWIKRQTEWVAGVLGGTHHTPFARIKTTTADITADEARAKGYVKATMKKEEVFGLLKRVTTPTTIYKKQKLDRDDLIDITDMNVVAWLKAEMRMMLEEELARAILIGDGREPEDADKIQELNIRPISKDAEMYSHPVVLDAAIEAEDMVEQIIRARKFYKGTGTPTFYTTTDTLIDMLLLKDKMGRRLYNTEAELASALRVAKIVEVQVMENQKVELNDLVGIIVNLKDYTVGADKGGEVALFDDFDIDYNQYKYLIETRVSGALTIPKAALVIQKTPAGEGA